MDGMSSPILHSFEDGKCRLCGATEQGPCAVKAERRAAFMANINAAKWTPERAVNAFSYRPRKGDMWELKLPKKAKRIKTVARIFNMQFRRGDRLVILPVVEFKTEPKGRTPDVRVKTLLKYGKLLRREPTR